MSDPKISVDLTDPQLRAILQAIYLAQQEKIMTSAQRQALNHAAVVIGAARVRGTE